MICLIFIYTKIKLTDNTYVVSLFENCNVIPKYYKFNETELQWNEIIDDKDIMICKKYIDRLLNKLDNNKFDIMVFLILIKKLSIKFLLKIKKQNTIKVWNVTLIKNLN